MSVPRPDDQIDREVLEGSDAIAQHEPRGQAERSERLVDRLEETASFIRDRRRIAEFENPRPDYGTFLKDEELIELFPEAADDYSVDDIRRAVLMIRMILDYGEAAFTVHEGDVVHTLIKCILDQEDFWFDGTWSPNNPATKMRARRVCSFEMPGLNFDDDNDDLDGDDFDWDADDDDFVPQVAVRGSAPEPPVREARHYRIPDCFEESSLPVRTRVHDGERRLDHLLSMLGSDEFRCYTNCFVQPEELHFIRSVGGWLLGLDPAQYTTEVMLNALGDIWELIRARGRQDETATGGPS